VHLGHFRGRIPQQPAAFPLLVRSFVRRLGSGSGSSADGAQFANHGCSAGCLLFGGHLNSFNVQVECVLRLRGKSDFTHDRECVAAFCRREVRTALDRAARYGAELEFRRALQQRSVAAVDNVVCDEAEAAGLLGAH
jgi:hypothetical protein